MPRHHYCVISHFISTVFLLSLLLTPAYTNAATPAVSEPQATREADTPLTLSLDAMPTDGNTVKLTVNLEAPVVFDDINLQFGLATGLTLVSTTVPTHTVLAAGEHQTYETLIASSWSNR